MPMAGCHKSRGKYIVTEDESKTMGKLIEEEIERINEKNGKKERQ